MKNHFDRKIEFRKTSYGRNIYRVRKRSEINQIIDKNKSNFGLSLIFGFAYNIYCIDDIETIDETHNGIRYRIHKPFRIKNLSDTISTDVPFDHWPMFSWSDIAIEDDKVPPPSDVILLPDSMNPPDGKYIADAIRIDFWGNTNEIQCKDFVSSFLEWLRFATNQPWINRYEYHNDSHLKYAFYIDQEGNCVERPRITRNYVLFPFNLLDNTKWFYAFRNAANNNKVLRYWSLFFDSNNLYAQGSLPEACLTLTLSIEVAKDINFQRFCNFTTKKGIIKFSQPFDSTDLLKHISIHLENLKGRNFKREYPELFSQLERLYITRHHVAHGKHYTIQKDNSLEPLRDEDFERWYMASSSLIIWMQHL